jgi:hypothetical protein
VVYLGQDNQGVFDSQVHELYADGSNEWHHNNLTTAAGAPLALTTPTGYEFRKIQHVVYQGLTVTFTSFGTTATAGTTTT